MYEAKTAEISKYLVFPTQKSHTPEASKSAHPFELNYVNTVKLMHCTALSGVTLGYRPCQHSRIQVLFIWCLMQRVGHFPI